MAMTCSSAHGEARTLPAGVKPTIFRILFAIGLVHMLNDSMQAVIPAVMPILKDTMQLSYAQVGLVIFALNFTSSLLQPAVGLYTDAKPSPYMLPLGMVSSFAGMLLLGLAPNYGLVLLGVVMVGLGSAVFHPEGSRVSHMAAGSRRGLAQSIFQVGGNGGQALAPIMTAMIFVPLGQIGAVWFTLAAGTAFFVQLYIAKWYRARLAARPRKFQTQSAKIASAQHRKRILFAVTLLVFLVFARSWYHACISGYYQFFIIQKFGLSVKESQYYIFCFLAAGALGTLLGGPLADRFGRKNILFFSILGAAPFALVLPYANAFWSYIFLFCMGFILLSSFSVSVVYAQELVPGKVGLVSGLTTGLAFGMGALGSVVLGNLADVIGISEMMKLGSFLPLLGLLTLFLPSDSKVKEWSAG